MAILLFPIHSYSMSLNAINFVFAPQLLVSFNETGPRHMLKFWLLVFNTESGLKQQDTFSHCAWKFDAQKLQ